MGPEKNGKEFIFIFNEISFKSFLRRKKNSYNQFIKMRLRPSKLLQHECRSLSYVVCRCLRRIESFYAKLNCFTLYWIVLRCIGSFYVMLHHFTSYCIVLRQIKSYKDVLLHFTLYCIVFRRIASFIVELNLIKAALDIFGMAFCGFDFSWILKMQITLEIS